MIDIPITSSRRNRRHKAVSARKKLWIQKTMIVVIVSLIFLFPVLSQEILAAGSILLAFLILFIFTSALIYLTVTLIQVFVILMRGANYRAEESNKLVTVGGKLPDAEMIIDASRLQKKISRGVESVLFITFWAFLLHLLEPFITALLWWQGYQLIVGNTFSLASVKGVFTIIEYSVYFGIYAFLVVLSWSEWKSWRCRRHIAVDSFL